MLIFVGNALAQEAPTIPVHIHTQTKTKTYQLELATTPATRETGLMNRDTLKPNDGMLFIFPAQKRFGFWMKNTRIPLDLLFINARHRVIHIARNATPYSLDPIAAPQPAISVIELDGGRTARDGIALGDSITYDLPATQRIE